MQEDLQSLIKKKAQLEARLSALTTQLQVLNSTKNLQKGLTDAEGFPRADLDFGELTRYRNLKREKAELNNDHFAIMKKIEGRLFELHQGYEQIDPELQQVKPKQDESFKKKERMQEPAPKQQQKQTKKQHNIDYLTPFAKITIVQNDSPASKGGLKLNDLVSQFSEVNIYTINYMKQIPKYVKEDKQLPIVVMRETNEANKNQQGVFLLKDGKYYKKTRLTVTPALWSGRGLLGCKIDPLQP